MPSAEELSARYASYEQLLDAATSLEQRSQVRRLRSRLTAAVIDQGWTRSQLADFVGTDPRTVDRWYRHADRAEPMQGISVPEPPPAPAWTVRTLAEHLQVDVKSVRRWIASGWLTATKTGDADTAAWALDDARIRQLKLDAPLWTVEQDAQRRGVPAGRVRIWVRRGKLDSVRLGGPTGPIRVFAQAGPVMRQTSRVRPGTTSAEPSPV